MKENETNNNSFNLPIVDMVATGHRLRELRIKNKYKVCQIKDYLHLSAQAYYKYEKAKCLPGIENTKALADLYGIKIDDIIVFVNNNPTA